MLPTTASLQQILPQSFVFFQPRDIVSGDFYWVAEVRKTGRSYVVLAVADCTGHGVPGAFVSMVGANILNNLVVEQKMVEPNRILSLLDKEVRKALQQDKGEGRDGMDIALISLTHQLQSTSFSQLEYAGAMNPLYYVQGGEMKEIKATKLPIGGEFTGEKQFTNHTIVLDTPTVIYLCSDGFQDQFGGEQNKKFMTRKLRELLFSLHALPMHTQKENLKQVFIDWKGEYEQIDDVTVMGLAV
jgi:serine phosphatase RsbU (regulator of sigma subunit)